MLGSDVYDRRPAHSETVDECLRSSLACQLACIACAEAGLTHARFEPRASLVRACLSALEASTTLTHVIVSEKANREQLRRFLLECTDACATCEAECLATNASEPRAQRCRSACSTLRSRCERLLSFYDGSVDFNRVTRDRAEG